MAISFKGTHFPKEVILMGVRWYVAYPLSTRHGDYSIFAGFWYGARGAFIVQFGPQHWNKEGKTVCGPGTFRSEVWR